MSDKMREALAGLLRPYVNALKAGRDRIIPRGGQCNSVDEMERAALAEQPAQGEAVVPADVQRVIDRLMSSDPDFDDCEDAANMLRRLASAPPAPAVPEGWKLVPDYKCADDIITSLYRRFKEWSARGFNAEDVTWCEVKADILALLAAAPEVPRG